MLQHWGQERIKRVVCGVVVDTILAGWGFGAPFLREGHGASAISLAVCAAPP
jgi:hypothetical protein